MPVRREIPSRSAAWLLLAALLALVAVRPAEASGCHEVDRPVLGLTLPGDPPSTWATHPEASPLVPHGLDRAPCPADPAGPSARPSLPAFPAETTEVVLAPRCLTILPPIDCDVCTPRLAASRWERPPRTGSI